MDRGAWQAIVHRVIKQSDMTESHTHTYVASMSVKHLLISLFF